VARKETLSPRRFFQYSTSSCDALSSLAAEVVPFTEIPKFEEGKEDMGLGLGPKADKLEPRGLEKMEGGVPLGLAVISFFSGLEVEGRLNEARGL
jgi:hypothetical protein